LPPVAAHRAVAEIGYAVVIDPVEQMDVAAQAEANVPIADEEILDAAGIQVHPGARHRPVCVTLILAVEVSTGTQDRDVGQDDDRLSRPHGGELAFQPGELLVVQASDVTVTSQ